MSDKHVPGAICIILNIPNSSIEKNDNGVICELVKPIQKGTILKDSKNRKLVTLELFWEVKNTTRPISTFDFFGINVVAQKYLKVIGGSQIDTTETQTTKLLEPA